MRVCPLPQEYTACATAQNGTFEHGLAFVMMKLIDTSLAMLNVLPMDNSTADDILMHTQYFPLAVQFNSIADPYFRNVSKQVRHSLEGDILAIISYTKNMQTILSVVFVLGFALFSLMFYIPSIRGVADRVQLTQSILFAFPDDLLGTVQSLRAEIHAIILRERTKGAVSGGKAGKMSPRNNMSTKSQATMGASRRLQGANGKPVMLKEMKGGDQEGSFVKKAMNWFGSVKNIGASSKNISREKVAPK